ncbi:MAG TPA: hypothetical protein VMZ73_06235 [Acidimicrobiales bacterium]|nr:hypothetical protein [Acidimicrobiales bacterium]
MVVEEVTTARFGWSMTWRNRICFSQSGRRKMRQVSKQSWGSIWRVSMESLNSCRASSSPALELWVGRVTSSA